jgi:pimeloyl-ACP methyl ester carboxylesterase
LQKDYHILTFDLPGFGRSSKANTVYSPTRYAELIRYLTGKYVNRPFHLAGHSMGGAIALRYAASYGEDLLSLTLVDAAGILHRLAYTKYLAPLGLEQFAGTKLPGRTEITDWAGALLGSVERVIPFGLDIVLHTALLREKLLKGNPSAIAALGLVLEDFSLAPGQVTVPTLIIWGEDDQVAPPRTGRVLAALIPQSTLHLIPNAGHAPISEELDAYLRLLRQHLDSPGSLKKIPVQHLLVSPKAEVLCENQRGKVYTGKIRRLVLNNCHDVLVHHAELEKLIIKSSRVVIEESVLKGEKNALFAVDSTVVLTAGSVEADLAIRSVNSRFDIAGTLISGRRFAVFAVGESEFIMSLVPVESTERPLTMLHGQQPLQYSFTL